MRFLENFSRRHGEHGAGELKGFRMGDLREIWRGCLSRKYTASSQGFGRQVEDTEAAIKDRFRSVLASKSIICLGAQFVSIWGRSASPPSVKKLDGIMAIRLKFLVNFRCDCPGWKTSSYD